MSMTMSTQKRKHKTLTLKEKSEILDRLNRNESFSKLASEYGVGRSTIYDINKNRENIQRFVATTCYEADKRQTLKKADHPEVDKALYLWFCQQRNRNTRISGHTLAMKAKFFYKEITKKDDFVASKGWLERFKIRYGIRLMTTSEDKLATDTTCLEPFLIKFSQKVKDLGLGPSQVYNADESGLFWSFIPNILVSCDDKTETKLSKEHVTILPCANATGTHLLRLAVIGKTKNAHVPQNFNIPVQYYEQRSARMTKELFKKWFDEYFAPEVRKKLKENNLPQKALLLLRNAPNRPSEEELMTEDKCIIAMFLPPNCTTLIQPMDQHIIQFLKQDYKKRFLQTAFSKEQSIEKALKDFSMKDLAFALSQSWNSFTPSTITSSWINLWPEIVTTPCVPQIEDISEIIEQVATATDISKDELEIWYYGMDEEDSVFQQLSDKDIVNKVITPMVYEEDEDEVVTTPQVSAINAVNAFEVGMQWAKENGASNNELLLLRRLRDKALLMRDNVKHK